MNEITSKAAYPYWIFNDVTESTKIGAQNLSHGAQWLLTALKSQYYMPHRNGITFEKSVGDGATGSLAFSASRNQL